MIEPTRVHAGAFWWRCRSCSVARPGSCASALTASAAARIASCIACCGWVPRGSDSSSASLAALAAAADASSGRLADETPSQTIATTAGEPSGRAVVDTANESSLR